VAQAVDKPLNSGAVEMPKIDGGQNKFPPRSDDGSRNKGGKNPKMLRSSEQGDDEEDQKIIRRALKRLDLCIQVEGENRKPALEDRKFWNGDQWPADVSAQRLRDQRPCLTVNKLKTITHQITNEQRQNRPAININPVGDKGDIEVAKMYRGLVRAIERDSVADIAYDTAYHDAVISGFGYWRLMTEYESPDSMNQVIVIKRIRNPFTVYGDVMSQEPDGSDWRYGFVTELIPRSQFDDEYPDADPMSWTVGGIGETMKNWITQDAVRVAEYFEITFKKRTLVQLENGFVGWEDELEKEAKDRYKVINERESEEPEVMWYKMTALEILERRPWVGKWIPIVKMVGDEIDIEGRSKLSGVVRDAKDPQRAYNYGVTAEMEQIALAPKAPFVMAEGQDEGHEDEWQKANVTSYPVLHYKQTDLEGEKAPPPQRQPGPQPAAGWQSIKQAAQQDIMGTTGIRFDATTQERMYDESGRALKELRQRGDLGSFHYLDNMARSLRHTGEMILDLAPKIYDTPRVITILREDDSEERVKIDPSQARPMMEQPNGPDGKKLKIFNPTYGKYGVTTTIGPSYATKRIEASESMMDFARAIGAPNAMLFADLIAKNQDWPGAEQIEARMAKIIAQQHPGAVAPDMKDVSPQVQAMLQGLQQQNQQLQQQVVAMNRTILDQDKDRQVKRDADNHKFEAALLSIAQKAEASQNAHVGSQIQDLVKAVTEMHQSLMKPPEARTQ
jgi:hypothetical protein